MNVIGILFAGVVMISLIFFCIGASQTLIDGTSINSSDELYTEFETSKDISSQTLGFAAFIPYLTFIAAFFGALLMLTKSAR